MSSQPTVYIVDDDKAVRDSLAFLISSVGLPVRVYPDAAAFLRVAATAAEPLAGCVLIDLRLPGMSGLDLQEALSEQAVNLPVIVITGHGDVPAAVRAMKGGAVDFIEKPFSDQRLLGRIREAMDRDAERRETDVLREIARQRLERLTPREQEVMDLVVQGKLNKQIASELGLSPKTVEVHRAHVMEKMEAGSVAQLVRMAIAARDNGVGVAFDVNPPPKARPAEEA